MPGRAEGTETQDIKGKGQSASVLVNNEEILFFYIASRGEAGRWLRVICSRLQSGRRA